MLLQLNVGSYCENAAVKMVYGLGEDEANYILAKRIDKSLWVLPYWLL